MQTTSRTATSPITRERVIGEALAIADVDGFEALSLRAVARRLGVTPMALYRYVESSNELGDLVVTRIVQDHTSDVAWPNDARAALRLLAATVVDLIRSHPTMLERYQRGGVFTQPAMRVIDQLLGVLCGAGLTGAEAVGAYTAVHYYALGFAALTRGPGEHAPHAAPDPAEFPVLAANFQTWQTTRDDQQFRDALEIVIDAFLGAKVHL